MRRLYLLLLTCLAVQFAWAQPEIRLDDASATAGSQVAVPVIVSEGGSITAIQFSISFQTEGLSVVQNGILAGASLVDHSVGSNQEDGTLVVVIFSGSLSPLKAGPGILVNVLFDVASTALAGSTINLTLSDVQASDSNRLYVPVTPRDGVVSIDGQAGAPSEGENELVFAQMANGAFTGGTFDVVLIFVNRTGAPVAAEARFFKSDGTPFVLGLTDGQMDSRFSFSVSAGGSAFLRTDGEGDLAAGYARVSATAPLGGTLLFCGPRLTRDDPHRGGCGGFTAGRTLLDSSPLPSRSSQYGHRAGQRLGGRCTAAIGPAGRGRNRSGPHRHQPREWGTPSAICHRVLLIHCRSERLSGVHRSVGFVHHRGYRSQTAGVTSYDLSGYRLGLNNADLDGFRRGSAARFEQTVR